MITCHLCGQPWNRHAPTCRVPTDIARMRGVHRRLTAEGRDDALRAKIERYLDLFGHLDCQTRPGEPGRDDCSRCGFGDICVILPEALRA